ncbi:MAG: hypothetical protein PWR03_473 [Tenuifilum sp.]|nr:hypothetical protein [Tenuifilum sp.]
MILKELLNHRTYKTRNMQKMRRYIFIAILLVTTYIAKAQPEVTLPYMHNVFQASFVNPTIMPEHTFSTGFSVFGQAISNGFQPTNFMSYRTDTMYVNLNSLLGDMNDKNMIYLAQNADLFHIRAKVLSSYFWFAIRQNSSVTLQYPSDLFRVAIEGNQPFVGSSIDLSNLKSDISFYNEYTIGYLKDLPRWTFAGRISILQGLANLNFNPDVLKVEIDTAFAHTGVADARMRTAGLPHNADGDINFDGVDDQWALNKFSSFANKGFAISGGATFKYDERLNLSFSFYDLGFIKWKTDVQTYTLKGQSSFSGFDILSDLLAGNDFDVDSVLQDMEDDFTRDTISSSYTTWLNPKFNFTANYQLARRTMVGVTFAAFVNRRFYPSVSIGISQGVGRFFQVVGTASVYQRSIPNLGVGLVFKPGPFQFFVVADNLRPIAKPLSFTNANVRVGLNLVFGRVYQPQGLPYK